MFIVGVVAFECSLKDFGSVGDKEIEKNKRG